MSDNVVPMPGFHAPVKSGEPVPRVVEILETFLEEAKRGDLVAVAIAAVQPDSTPGAQPFTRTGFEYAAGNGYALESAINRLHRRYGRYMDPNE